MDTTSNIFFHACYLGQYIEMSVGRCLVLHWNPYKAITKVCELSWQVIFHDRDIENDFLKTAPGEWQNSCVL